mmetsp:Transcript_79129/g.223732  ORF Transcript_79129/g.223732 Transcript_79129/m.223732 type:complete len:237 (+) Transcript_79129:325-1035(+)
MPAGPDRPPGAHIPTRRGRMTTGAARPSLFLAHNLGKGDVLPRVRHEVHREVGHLLRRPADNGALASELLLIGHARGVDAREVGPAERLAVHLAVAGQVADSAGAALVQVGGARPGQGAADGAPLRALGPGLARGSHDAVDAAGVPDDEVAGLRHVLGAALEAREVTVLEVHEDRLLAHRPVPVRTQQVLRRPEVVLAALVHGHPPADRVREVDWPVLVVLVPAEALVRIYQQHVR